MADPNTGCVCMTSQTGCLIIGWLEVISLFPIIFAGILLILAGAIGIPRETLDLNQLFGGNEQAYRESMELAGAIILAVGLLYLFAPCCLIHGASRGKPAYVMAYGVCAVLKTLASLAWIGLLFNAGAPLRVLGFVGAVVVTEAYKTVVVFCHYDYMTERREYDNELLNMSAQKSATFSM